jgi:hypothetical protein
MSFTSITEPCTALCMCNKQKDFNRLIGDRTALPEGWTWREIQSQHVQPEFAYIMSCCPECSAQHDAVGNKRVMT